MTLALNCERVDPLWVEGRYARYVLLSSRTHGHAENTFHQVATRFETEPRGRIEVKHMDTIAMYFLNRTCRRCARLAVLPQTS